LNEKETKEEFKCISCGKHLSTKNSLMLHKANCKIHKIKQAKELEKYEKQIFKDYEEGYSILQIFERLNVKNEYISYSSIRKFLIKNDKHILTISEAKSLSSTQEKRAKTVIKKYGGTGNILSKGSSAYEKRNETVKERYGVENVFQIETVKEKIFDDEHYIKNYGLTRRELLAEKGSLIWSSYSEQERAERIKVSKEKFEKTIFEKYGLSRREFHKIVNRLTYENLTEEKKLEGMKRLFNKIGSSLEIRVETFLSECSIKFEKQFRIPIPERKLGYFYDFLLNDEILIEVNGDFWHANPRKYKPEDVLKFPGNVERTAEDIWFKDFEKAYTALENGYEIIYIWEYDINRGESWKNQIKSLLK
jgi:hypothetical protein